VFSETPRLAPYSALLPQVDIHEMNPSQGPAAQMSEGLDLRAADRSDDALFNRILWYMLRQGSEAPPASGKAPFHLLQVAQ